LADQQFRAVFCVAPATVQVALIGALDFASAPQAWDDLAAACGVGSSRDVEIDLETLTFCDSAGLSVFEQAEQRCAERGALLVLTNPRPPVLRLLELTGLTRLLADDRRDAGLAAESRAMPTRHL
jgi:anti-anti-sigma factor